MTPASNTPSVFLEDADCTLYHGDVLATLRELPAESVDCVVTSPPYWGLRDYGTGTWEGGDAGCDHKQTVARHAGGRVNVDGFHGSAAADSDKGAMNFRNICGKCGARRIDQQLGLEPTPEQYVERMVEVFREVRRVLAAHGTCWVNLGDSYSTQMFTRQGKPRNVPQPPNDWEGTELGDRGRAGNYDLVPRTELGSLKAKDLCGIPWRVAFALQADGWYLRSDIIWSKPNPMPESVTDRPTKAHEYVFLLSKQPRYFFDQEAVREKAEWNRWGDQTVKKPQPGTASWIQPKGKNELPRSVPERDRRVSGFNERWDASEANGTAPAGRNIRSVWEIATQPYPEAHFATFPEELARRAIAAGCPERVCRTCGKPSERIVESVGTYEERKALGYDKPANMRVGEHEGSHRVIHPPGMSHDLTPSERIDLGWSDCGHDDYRVGIVLDPFMGSGTTAYVARKLGRHSVGIDLSAEYLTLAARRLQQQSLFAEVPGGL